MVYPRPGGRSRADGGSSYGSNSEANGSRVVNQVHGLDVVAGVMRLDLLQGSAVVANQSVVRRSQEIAVAEGAPVFQLDFEPGSGGEMLDRAPVCFLRPSSRSQERDGQQQRNDFGANHPRSVARTRGGNRTGCDTFVRVILWVSIENGLL